MSQTADANNNEGALTALTALAHQAQMLSENIAMNMLQLGRVFTEAKDLVERGQWGAWVQENSGMSERYAQQFMQAYARYGESSRYAALGKSKLIKLLALPEGEEERFLTENDVSAMSAREVESAVRAEREKWQRRVEELESREPEIPEAIFHSIKEKDLQITQQREEIERIAEQQRDLLNEAGQLRAENASIRREYDEQTDIIKDMQEDLDRAQRELLDARSDIARGDAERVPADQLTAEAFSAAVQQFIGKCARLPHMRMTFAAMAYKEKLEYSELLATVESWAADSRRAIDTVLAEGSVI